MKAVVMSMFLFNTALAAVLGEVLTPVTVDPHLIWVWAGLAVSLQPRRWCFGLVIGG